MSLKIIKRKGSPFYYVRGSVKGVEIFESTKTARKSEAESYRINRENDLDNIVSTLHQKRLFDAIDAYIRKGGENRHLDPIREKIGMLFLEQINQEVLDVTARELYPHQSNASLIRWFYGPISWVMNYAAELKWCPYIKVRKPKVQQKPPRWAEMEWFEAFWPHCSEHLRAISVFLAYTGCRITEVLNLSWEDISLKEQRAYIPHTKNSTPRMVYLPPFVVEELKVIKPENATGKIFPWGKQDAVNQALRRTNKRINKMRREEGLAEIPHLSTHKLGSHTYATWMRRYAKIDQRGLLATGRWKSIDSTLVYTHTSISEEAEKAALLPVPKKKTGQKLCRQSKKAINKGVS